MKLPRLELDFRRQRTSSLAGFVLLAVGLAAMAVAITSHRTMLREVTNIQHRLVAVSKTTTEPKGKAPVAAMSPRAMREIVDRLNVGWDDLFAALEKAADKNMTLLAIQPDPVKGVVTLRGEARNLYAVLHYLQSLQDGGQLEEIDLVEHEIGTQNPEMPVRFAIRGHWLRQGKQS